MEKSNKGLVQTPPHVIVVPYPSQGHINPLLQFAKRLAAMGVRATLATTLTTVNSIDASTVAVEPISDGFDHGGFGKAGSEGDYLKSLRDHGSHSLSQLLEKYKTTSFPVSCIIYDAFFPWALDVAKQHGVWGAAFFTNSATVCAVFSDIHHGTLTLPVNVKPLILPGLPPLNACDIPSFIRAPESYPAYLAMKLSQFSNLAKADFVFANTFHELEGQEAKSVEKLWPAKLVGPMVPSAYLGGRDEGDKGYGASLWKPLSEQCRGWLDTKPPQSVIYISFGSMVSLSSKQMEQMAWALISASINSYFLWVVRETERQKLPSGFMESINGKGMIVSWCNQLEVLAHPAVGCFVTHCGWNSTLEGLALGWPMVALPQWADQMTDAKFIEEIWRVGVRAKEDEFGIAGREELVYCLKAVMEEGERREEMRRNSTRWRDSARRTTLQGGTSHNAIHEFVIKLMEGRV